MSLPTRQIGGHKVRIGSSVPLKESLTPLGRLQVEGYEEEKDEVRVIAGYKATLKSGLSISSSIRLMSLTHFSDPNVSQEAKDHARELLEERGAL